MVSNPPGPAPPPVDRLDLPALDAKWQRIWEERQLYRTDMGGRRPFYCLMMFPYPSAERLHIGNAYAFTGADVYGRYRVRMEEMRQSIAIVRQTLEWLDHHPGRVLAEKVPRFVGTPTPPPGRESYILRRGYPKGRGFAAIEEPHGEALAYVINEGAEHPYRVKFRSPVMVNIAAAKDYLVGYRVSDIPPIMGSVDICVGESDR